MSFYRDLSDKSALRAWNTRPREVFRHFGVTPLAPTIGARIEGLDLSAELDDEQAAELRRALDTHLVLAIPGQRLDREAHKRLGRQFGALHSHLLGKARVIKGETYDPEILSWQTGAGSTFTAGDAWHADVSCDAHPIQVSALHVTRLPEVGGGDTAFANMYLAYESLSDRFKSLLAGLTALHDGGRAWTAGYGSQPDTGRNFPATEHPVVARHPRTGRPFLYVNPAFTSHIVQLPRHESDALLGFLHRHVERSLPFQVRVGWEEDMILLWDNWATQHHAVWDYYPFERWGERVSAVPAYGPVAA
ncbi:TauD/TfdA dioxygenase family protein [Zavarzinia sp.]|uniref:TauD/TfdA dioxygenase family protein n=1 Tax=Zavarzinia sp. TaxID=2027920 RepID=UPI0035633094